MAGQTEQQTEMKELIPDLVEDAGDAVTFKEFLKPAPDLSGAIIEEDKNKRVPITILTGYLGSGKSTLLDQISKRGDRRLAVILNEFGDSIDIEKSLTYRDNENNEIEEWLDLGNGCLCCTVKDNGVAAIERLVNKKKNFDHIILETTGLADPGPITTMFWLDDGLLSNVYIDGVVTVLDSENIEKCLNDIDDTHNHSEHHGDHHDEGKDLTVAHIQIALADVILLNKIDKITANDKDRIENRIRSINSNVPIYETSYGDISLDKILDLHAYEAKDINELINVKTTNVHDHRMGTVTFDFRKFKNDQDYDNFEKFLQDILWDERESNGRMEIHRTKGLIFLKDGGYRVIQGVRKTYDIVEGNQEVSDINLDLGRLVVIGKCIDVDSIKRRFAMHLGFQME